MKHKITQRVGEFLESTDDYGRYQSLAVDLLDVDLVRLAESYTGELVRGSSQRQLIIRQARRGQLSIEAHGEIS